MRLCTAPAYLLFLEIMKQRNLILANEDTRLPLLMSFVGKFVKNFYNKLLIFLWEGGKDCMAGKKSQDEIFS